MNYKDIYLIDIFLKNEDNVQKKNNGLIDYPQPPQ